MRSVYKFLKFDESSEYFKVKTFSLVENSWTFLKISDNEPKF